MLAEMNFAWTEADPQRVVRPVDAQFILLLLRQRDEEEAVEARMIWAADLGGAQNEARRQQMFDATVRQITVLDAMGRRVLAVLRSEPRAARSTKHLATLQEKRDWSRPAYH